MGNEGSAAELVRAAAKEAIRRAGSAGKLAEQLQREVGRPYNYRTVSGWARGDSMPPADALLAAARATELSLDQFLFGEETGLHEQLRRLAERVADLEAERPPQTRPTAGDPPPAPPAAALAEP